MSLEDRIARLESQQRFWKVMVVAQVAFIGLVLSCTSQTAQTPNAAHAQVSANLAGTIHDEIKVRRLQIVDDTGKVFAAIGHDSKNRVTTLTVGNYLRKNGVLIAASEGLVRVSAVSSKKAEVTVGGSANEVTIEESGITMYPFDKAYADARSPGSLSDADTMFRTSNERRKAVVIGFNDEGGGQIELRQNKSRLVELGAGEGSGGGMINVFNPSDKRVVSIQSDKGNAGAVSAWDVNGENGIFFSSPLPK